MSRWTTAVLLAALPALAPIGVRANSLVGPATQQARPRWSERSRRSSKT